MPRSRRLTALSLLLSERRFTSQDELARALTHAGFAATQATLSRDLKSLGAGKRPGADGRPTYDLPAPAVELFDRQRQRIDLVAFVNDVRTAQNLVVIKTPPGHANGVGRAIDLLEFPGTMGSVAGDDTLLVVMASTAAAKKLKRHLDSLGSGESRAARTAP